MFSRGEDSDAQRAPLILVIDDVADNREVACDLLTASGYQTISAEDGESGIEAVHRHMPDVILMDLSMPRVDGFEATQTLKREKATAEIPIIAVTGYVLEARQSVVFDAWEACLTKPIDAEKLLDAIERALHKRSRSRA